jgi:hypothetical protein
MILLTCKFWLCTNVLHVTNAIAMRCITDGLCFTFHQTAVQYVSSRKFQLPFSKTPTFATVCYQLQLTIFRPSVQNIGSAMRRPCPSVCPSVLSACPILLSICPSVLLSVGLSVCPSIRLSYPSVRLSICPIRLSVRLFFYPSLCPSVLSVCPILPSVSQSVCLSVCP